MKTYAFRLNPGQDLRSGIDAFVKENRIMAGVILTCVGNLKKVVLRMPGGKMVKTYEGSFEIASVVGTLESGNSHIHMSLSDLNGNVFGGHLKEGSLIGVTAEVVIGELDNVVFTRKLDKQTGYDELVVKNQV